MTRGGVLFFLMFLSAFVFSQVDTAFSQLINKGDEYAVLYFRSTTLFKGPSYTVLYSNEKPDSENLNKKFRINDTTYTGTSQILLLCFKYLNQKGYTLVSSTSEVVNYLHKEFYFVRPRKDGKK